MFNWFINLQRIKVLLIINSSMSYIGWNRSHAIITKLHPFISLFINPSNITHRRKTRFSITLNAFHLETAVNIDSIIWIPLLTTIYVINSSTKTIIWKNCIIFNLVDSSLDGACLVSMKLLIQRIRQGDSREQPY